MDKYVDLFFGTYMDGDQIACITYCNIRRSLTGKLANALLLEAFLHLPAR